MLLKWKLLSPHWAHSLGYLILSSSSRVASSGSYRGQAGKQNNKAVMVLVPITTNLGIILFNFFCIPPETTQHNNEKSLISQKFHEETEKSI